MATSVADSPTTQHLSPPRSFAVRVAIVGLIPLFVIVGSLTSGQPASRAVFIALAAGLATCGWSALVLPRPWRTWGLCFVTGIGLIGPILGLVALVAPGVLWILLLIVGAGGLWFRMPETDSLELSLGMLVGLPYVLFIKGYQPFPFGASFGYPNYVWNALRMLDGSYFFEPERHIPGVAGFIAAQQQSGLVDGISALWAASALLPLIFTAGLTVMLRSLGVRWLPTLVAAAITPFLLGQDQFQHLHAFIQRSLLLTAIPWVTATLIVAHRQSNRWSKFTVNDLIPLAVGAVAILPLKWLLPGPATPVVILGLVAGGALLSTRVHALGAVIVGLLLGAVHLFEAPLAVASIITIVWLMYGPARQAMAIAGVTLFAAVFGSQRLGLISLDGSPFLAELLFGRATLPGADFSRKLASLRRAIAPEQLASLAILSAIGFGDSEMRRLVIGAAGALAIMFSLVFVPGDVQDGFTRVAGHSLPVVAILLASGLQAALSLVVRRPENGLPG